ncbi:MULTISPECIES: CHAT domain-containing protein [unclassified Dolichospermum]|uniref:CHAT domain-containing protein n=1 Tax=unclassified Dolichospermum TaxID=2622029 RepID=UPI0014455403|nr:MULTISPECIES: CHAT domain-containing protein [unclassified Dolichospermum]MTJ15840.1 CHAT domain-containing protein [Dolichospermum sp. UHCC 0299]MTJ41609.1 CHAT domain-containing protein [Dolichospermum sp. UHCC 0406]
MAMQSQRRKSKILRFLGTLFLSTLTISLFLGHIPLGNLVTAQTPNANVSQLVEEGFRYYQSGDYTAAIEKWQPALEFYKQSNNQPNQAIVQENLAIAYQQLGQGEQAIGYWQQVISYYHQQEDRQRVGQLLTEQAQTYNSMGQPKQAIALLCNDSLFDEKLDSHPVDKKLDSPSDEKLDCKPESAVSIARTYKNKKLEVAALGSLGLAYRLHGKYELADTRNSKDNAIKGKKGKYDAIKVLEEAKNINEEISDSVYKSSIFNNLGNAYFGRSQMYETFAMSAKQRNATDKYEKFNDQADNDSNQAIKYFDDSFNLAQNYNSKMQARLNLIRVFDQKLKGDKNNQSIDQKSENEFKKNKYLKEAINLIGKLPDSRQKVYAVIDLAIFQPYILSDDETSYKTKCPQQQVESEVDKLLNTAISIAEKIKDSRSKSFALGELGHIYACRKNYVKALEKTNEARLAAEQDLLAKDSLYLWEWQAGQILNKLGRKPEAIDAYDRAYQILKDIRKDILIADRNLQFDFRDFVQPLYRQLAKLKLEDNDDPKNSTAFALQIIDDLRIAELENYFGKDCELIKFKEKEIDELVQEDTAIFSSISLKESTAIIVNLPNPEHRFNSNADKRINKLHWIKDNKKFTKKIEKLRETLEDRTSHEYKPFETPSSELYQEIFGDFISDLDNNKIQTLVFNFDGLLRSIPMGALLYDKKNSLFLIQKYAIAVTPSLSLTVPEKLNSKKDLRVLALGLSEKAELDSGEKFQSLDESVKDEIKEVTDKFPNSKLLLNKDFRPESLSSELNKSFYPIIHIATHGQFGILSEDTFLVTGKKNTEKTNGKITITQLEKDVRKFTTDTQKFELLVLSACQTAVGDDRTTLGLGGIALQSGARSALASLWYIPGNSFTTKLVTAFYENWKDKGMSKAKALQEAQKALIKPECIDDGCHPAYWSPFILIGNWL